jgi:hypothetical protein
LRNGFVHLRHSVAEPEQLASLRAKGAGRFVNGGTRRAIYIDGLNLAALIRLPQISV